MKIKFFIRRGVYYDKVLSFGFELTIKKYQYRIGFYRLVTPFFNYIEPPLSEISKGIKFLWFGFAWKKI